MAVTLKHGSYYWVGRVNGKQKWIKLCPEDDGKRRANELAATIVADKVRGTLAVPDKNSTVGVLFDAYLAFAATRTRAKTAQRYRQLWEQHLSPRIALLPIAAVTGPDLQRLYSELLDSGRRDGKGQKLSPRTVHHIHALLRQAFNAAVDWKLLPRNPVSDAKPPKVQPKELRILSPKEAVHLLRTAASSRYGPLVTLALLSGARRSELLGLRRGDVDIEAGTITINRTIHRLRDGTFVVEAPKSRRSRRTITLPPAGANALRIHIERLEADLERLGMKLTPERYLFANADGSPITPDLFSGAFRKIALRAGFPGLRLHDARHSHASLLIAAGESPRAVSERLGHSSVAFTMDTYVHLFADADSLAANKVGALLEEAATQENVRQTVRQDDIRQEKGASSKRRKQSIKP